MAEKEQQFGSNRSPTVSDKTLRLYLLCRLGEAERLALDERLLIDDEVADRVKLAESELTDDFASGRLNAVDRESFEKRFLTTESRRQKLRFSSALHDYAGAQASPAPGSHLVQNEKPSWREGLTGLFGFGRPRIWAVAGSFAVLIMLVGLAWFVTRPLPDSEPVITRNEPIPGWSPQVSPQAVAPSPSVSPSPQSTRKPETIPTPAEPAAPATIASFVLLPGAVRGGGEMLRVAVPDGERDLVRLGLVLETGGEGIYQAELATAEGQKVLVRSKLKTTRNGQTKVVLSIPARLLQSGDYQIKLSRQKADGQLEPVGRYYFRALD